MPTKVKVSKVVFGVISLALAPAWAHVTTDAKEDVASIVEQLAALAVLAPVQIVAKETVRVIATVVKDLALTNRLMEATLVATTLRMCALAVTQNAHLVAPPLAKDGAMDNVVLIAAIVA